MTKLMVIYAEVSFFFAVLCCLHWLSIRFILHSFFFSRSLIIQTLVIDFTEISAFKFILSWHLVKTLLLLRFQKWKAGTQWGNQTRANANTGTYAMVLLCFFFLCQTFANDDILENLGEGRHIPECRRDRIPPIDRKCVGKGNILLWPVHASACDQSRLW